MPDYIDLMRMKRTAALAVALLFGTIVLIASLFVDVPVPAQTTASADPVAEADDGFDDDHRQ